MSVVYSNNKTGHALERAGRAFMVRYPSGHASGPYPFRDALKKYKDATAPRLLRWKVEVTDTFGGEANYAWVRRYSFDMDENASDVAVMRRAKREAGYSGARGKRETWGRDLIFRPYRECVVMFVRPLV